MIPRKAAGWLLAEWSCLMVERAAPDWPLVVVMVVVVVMVMMMTTTTTTTMAHGHVLMLRGMFACSGTQQEGRFTTQIVTGCAPWPTTRGALARPWLRGRAAAPVQRDPELLRKPRLLLKLTSPGGPGTAWQVWNQTLDWEFCGDFMNQNTIDTISYAHNLAKLERFVIPLKGKTVLSSFAAI